MMEKFNIDDYIVAPGESVSKRVIYKDENTLAFILNIAPGKSLPEHTHENSTLMIQILNGEGIINIDGNPVSVEKNHLVQLEGQEEMSVDNTGEEILELYVTISPKPLSDRYSQNADL